MENNEPATQATLACLALIAEAKTALVAIDGIGTELLPSVLAYEGNRIIGYAILHNLPSTPQHLYQTLSQAVGLMVTGWHATGLALAIEGYTENDAHFEEGNNKPSLASRYPTDSTINEALWCAYTDRLGNSAMGVITYTQTVGRTVIYDEPTITDTNQLETFDETGTLPNLLRRALTHLGPHPHPPNSNEQTCRELIADTIHSLGYSVVIEGSEYWTDTLKRFNTPTE